MAINARSEYDERPYEFAAEDKKLVTPCDHSRNYLIRDFDAVCADRAMTVLTSADRKILAEARLLRSREMDLPESHLKILARYDEALATALADTCNEGVQIIVLPSGGE